MQKTETSRLIYDKRAIELAVKSDDYIYDENGTSMRDAFNRYLRFEWTGLSGKEARALQADIDVYGGFAATPPEVARQILHNLNNELFIRRLATVWAIPTAESLGVPYLDNDPADPTWTAEIQTGTEDSTMSFEKRQLTPHPLAKRLKVSNRLLRSSVVNME